MDKTLIMISSIVLVFIAMLCGCGAISYYLYNSGSLPENNTSDIGVNFGGDYKLAKFSSDEEFIDYLSKSSSYTSYYGGSGPGRMTNTMIEDLAFSPNSEGTDSKTSVDRYSVTNIQVQGVDEPDIVKTDGKNIYYSSNSGYYYPMMIESEKMSDNFIEPYYRAQTKIIGVKELEKLGDIDLTGNLLFKDDVLIIQQYNKLVAYDVSDEKKPEKIWDYTLDGNTSIDQLRFMGDDIYMITRSYVSMNQRCPIPLMEGDNVKDISIPCTSIYRPDVFMPSSSTFTILKLDYKSGDVVDDVSFMGSNLNSVVYMSQGNIYVSNELSEDMVQFMYDFYKTEMDDLIPERVLSKIQLLISYDISNNAKSEELNIIMQNFQSSMSEDDSMKLQNEMTNRMDKYYSKNKRSLEKTGITKVDTDTLDISATGYVSGRLLNQFSMDEYEGKLRIVTTVGEGSWFGRFNVSNSENDLYVLDEGLELTGSVLGLGEGERIYSARFVGDLAYMVTFRQIDPFFVFDLSDYKNPKKTGELKIPGYSSYLHPISDGLVLGVGKEGSNVKLSLFDVQDSSDPKEIDKYILDEYWSAALDNHHAFLIDKQNSVFFIPGGEGGYVFSYEDSKLSLKKSVKEFGIERAVVINQSMYLLSPSRITVVDEATWEVIDKLDLN